MKFTLNEEILIKLWEKCYFPLEKEGMIFFGLRSCIPMNFEADNFESEQTLVVSDYNHDFMRCTLGQWIPGSGIAVFPGSTVPSTHNVKRAKARGGAGSNMLMRGLYEYEKGIHRSGKPTGHKAFRQATWFPVHRTSDDLDYDNADPVDLSTGYRWDNLHCAGKSDPSDAGFWSAGCQVVAGYPSCKSNEFRGNSGPWALFYDNAYGHAQNQFTYGLFSGMEAAMLSQGANPSRNLRFNSRDTLVEQLQEALTKRGYDTNGSDGHFGRNTMEALLSFQSDEIGPRADDGIVGPITGKLLDIPLPRLDETSPAGGPSGGAKPTLIATPIETPVGAVEEAELTDEAVDMIKYFEAGGSIKKYLKAYQDPVGVGTIGYGHTGLTHKDGTVHKGREITVETAEKLLRHDLGNFVKTVRQHVEVALNPEQFGALVSFAFNLGGGNLGRSTLLKKLNKGDYDGAAKEFPNWCKAGGKRLLGLYRRRMAEKLLFEGKDWTKAKKLTM